MATKHQKVKIEIGEGFTKSQRKKIAKDIIDTIVDRSHSGYGVYGDSLGRVSKRRFPAYSQSYIDSLDFQIAGKSPGNVNLKLSGDMLEAIELLEDNGSSLVIGFEKGSEENARADGNIRGTYGGSSENPKKARPFLGVTRAELAEILSNYERK